MKIKTDIFIISWFGQHENAVKIAGEVAGDGRRVTIVYSDPDDKLQLSCHCLTLRRPNNLYFGDKLRACLSEFDADVFLLIHADCTSDSWQAVVSQCERTFMENPRVAIWSPEIDYSWYNLDKIWVADTRVAQFKIVAHTDSIVWGLRPGVVERLKKADYNKNIYGWGAASMAAAFAFANKMYAALDCSVKVYHPSPRGYPTDAAARQRLEFLNQLTEPEFIQLTLLQSHMAAQRMKRQESAGRLEKVEVWQ